MKRILCVLMILLPAVLYAQSGKIFTVERDLSNSNINVIFQDKSGYIWIGTDDGLNCYDGAKFSKYKHVHKLPNSLVDNFVLSINEVDCRRILIGTSRGLQLYDKATDTFRNIRFGYNNERNMGAYVSSILKRRNGKIMIATEGHGLYELYVQGNNVVIRKPKYRMRAEFINGLYEDKANNLWIATGDNGIMSVSQCDVICHYPVNGYNQLIHVGSFFEDSYRNIYITSTDIGIAKLNERTKTFMVPETWKDRIPVFSICQIGHRQLYIGTIGHGIMTYDIRTGAISDSQIKFNTFNFAKSEIHTMLKDVYHNLWIGVYGTGVVLLPRESGQFKYIGHKSINNDKIGSNRIISIFKDKTSSLWLGTANDGLYQVSSNGSTRHYIPTRGGVPPFVSGILQDSGDSYWLASLVDGLFRFNPMSGQCTKIPIYYKNKEMKGVTCITEDGNKNIWIGVMGGGLLRWDMRTKKMYQMRTYDNGQQFSENGNLLHNRWVSTLYYSGRDKLYIGTCDGLGCLDVKTMNFVSTYHKNRIFEGMIISVIYEDKHGYLWLGTSNGLIRYNEKTHASRIFTMHDGLPSDAICAIHDGNNNGLWISTDYGLSHYDTKTDKFVNFFSSDGLQNNEFSRCASFADCYGNLYFGGTDGVTYFNVKNLRYQTKKPDVKLVGLYINDKPVKAEMKSGMFTITKNAVSESSVFDFACDENNLTMEFSAMDFYNAERITYAYSINNGPWNVQRVGVNRVSFNNLSPGIYHFRIKSLDSDTSSDIKNITIVIHPAWYASGWAIFVYLMLLMIVLYITYVYIKNRYRRQKEMMKRQQMEEINEAKLQFFINISHEIRTPMSLIISPLQQLMSSDTDMIRQKTYCIINRNAQRILRLINQLMDIRKIDKGQMALRFSEHNVIGLIENICGDFEQQIGMKSIKFKFCHEMEKLNLWVDPNYFDKIIVNILSNAMKFTPDGGNITIDVRVTDKAEITISNTGSSIDEHEIEKIFGRFYQIRNSQNNSNIGTGIGLHLTRSLVELHHGDIHAENETDRMGCKFIIRLPLGNSHLRIDEMDVGTVQPTETVVEEMPTVFIDDDKRRRSTKHYILVVEDDEEIRKYICSQLRPEFNCKEGVNGKEAYQQILEQRPDLVISDVMMPEMDGFTLCKKIRLNTNVNTIPIVLLTAKTTIEDNLEGLDRGADAYITKPFNMNLLRKTVENLLSNREQLRNTYTGSQEQQDKITKLEAQSPDDKLMSRIMKVINANISNPDLNVEMITKEVGISRVHLYRKMKELTNQSMRDFIRNIRLKQAAILLSEKRYSVSEVVYMVGFSHISNFSTMFKNLYGMSPLEYREKMNSGNNESQD